MKDTRSAKKFITVAYVCPEHEMLFLRQEADGLYCPVCDKYYPAEESHNDSV